MRSLDLIGPLDWSHFPERDLKSRFGQTTYPYAAYVAAELIKLNEGLGSLNRLHRFLEEHSGFKSLLGFSPRFPLNWACSFNTPLPASCLPTQRHFTRVLRELPNSVLQFLLADSVKLIRDELHTRDRDITIGDVISLDTKHILAFVKENNPKTYISERFDKTHQPTGDPDCKLGCNPRQPGAYAATTRFRHHPPQNANLSILQPCRSVNTIGATALASSSPKSTVLASSSSPSLPSPSKVAVREAITAT